MSRPALLVIDHNSVTRTVHKEQIEAVCPPEIEVMASATAEEALNTLYALRDQHRAIEMAIVTQSMPGIPGGRLLEIVNAQFPSVGKILLSDAPSLEEAIYTFNNAAVDKYIPLPWGAEDVKFTITSLLRQRQMKRLNEKLLSDLQIRNQQLTEAFQNLQQARQDLERSYIQTVESLAGALEAKDRYTSGHSQRVARFATLIARSMELGKEEVEIVSQVALLHDIGKIGMVDTILNKPSNLTAEERELVKSHPVIGAQILGPVRTFQKHVAGIRHHHEMWDGSGYPDKLRGLEIPLAARIVSLADAFDAMTSTRPYRVGLPIAFAMQEMRTMRGRQFCPTTVDAFIRVLEASGVGDPQRPSATPASRNDAPPSDPLCADAVALIRSVESPPCAGDSPATFPDIPFRASEKMSSAAASPGDGAGSQTDSAGSKTESAGSQAESAGSPSGRPQDRTVSEDPPVTFADPPSATPDSATGTTGPTPGANDVPPASGDAPVAAGALSAGVGKPQADPAPTGKAGANDASSDKAESPDEDVTAAPAA